jgi:hypothetical protein
MPEKVFKDVADSRSTAWRYSLAGAPRIYLFDQLRFYADVDVCGFAFHAGDVGRFAAHHLIIPAKNLMGANGLRSPWNLFGDLLPPPDRYVAHLAPAPDRVRGRQGDRMKTLESGRFRINEHMCTWICYKWRIDGWSHDSPMERKRNKTQ